MGRIYTNTLLLILNKRRALRTELERIQFPDIILDQSHHPPISTNTPQMMRISEQTISLNANVYNVDSVPSRSGDAQSQSSKQDDVEGQPELNKT